MTRPRVLVVAYHFPPIGGSGVQRALKLARYLPDAGWKVHVLTTGHTHYPLLDPGLGDELGEEVVVHRVRGLDPGGLAATIGKRLERHGVTATAPSGPSGVTENRIFWRLEKLYGRLRLPEPEMLWVRAATRAARRLIAEHGIDAVVTTSPPHSTQWIGRNLRHLTGIPWIADLRDPIIDNFGYRPATRRADRYWHRLERTVALDSTRVIVTCPEAADCLRRRYPAAPTGNFATITNGYDPADRPTLQGPPARRNERFVISHVGAFYRAQTLQPLLDAVRQLVARRPDLQPGFTLRLVGSISADQRQLLRSADDAFLQVVGYRSHGQAIAEMARADALFLMTPAHPAGRNCIPAKLFEYLAFGGHVIALVHDKSSTARILTEAGNTTLVNHGDPNGLAHAMERGFDRWAAGAWDRERNIAFVRRFQRDALAREFAAVLSACLEGRPAPRHGCIACETLAETTAPQVRRAEPVAMGGPA